MENSNKMHEFTLQVKGYKTCFFHAGETILKEGESSKKVYILKEGSVRVNIGEIELSVLNMPGTILGEIDCLLECGHTASVVAETDTSLFIIDDFLAFLKNNPDNIKNICQLMNNRLRDSRRTVLQNQNINISYLNQPVKSYPKNHVIIEEGMKCDKNYILKEGMVKISANGNEVFRDDTPGLILGEISALTKSDFTTTVTTITKTDVYEINDFHEFLISNPQITYEIARSMAVNFTKITEEFTDLYSEIFKSRMQHPHNLFLENLEKMSNILSKDIASIFVSKTNISSSEAAFHNEISSLKSELESISKVYGNNHINTVSKIHNIAELYNKHKKYNEAIQYYKMAIDTASGIFGNEHCYIVNYLINLAVIDIEIKEYNEAEQLLLKALKIEELSSENNPSNLIKTLKYLSKLRNIESDFIGAEKYLARIIRIQKKVLGIKHPDLVKSLNDIAENYISQGKYQTAEIVCEESLGIRKYAFWDDGSEFSRILSKIASRHFMNGDYLVAERLYKKALSIINHTLEPESSEIKAINNMLDEIKKINIYEKTLPESTK